MNLTDIIQMTIVGVGFLAAVALILGFGCWLTRRSTDRMDHVGKDDDRCACGHAWGEHFEGYLCLMDGCDCDLGEDQL